MGLIGGMKDVCGIGIAACERTSRESWHINELVEQHLLRTLLLGVSTLASGPPSRHVPESISTSALLTLYVTT